MIVEHDCYVGLRDINSSKELTNTSLLSYLEDVACKHSEIAGYGIKNMEKTKRTWVLLFWKVKVIKRPNYGDTLKIKTWSKEIDKFYAFRDFEIFNKDNELVAIATSKWVFIDIEKGKLIKISDEVANKYQKEQKSVFEDKDFAKINEAEDYINKIEYKITKNMIDINNHLHNIYYMDIVKEVMPEQEISNFETNDFEIMYKKEIKLGETVKAIYFKLENLNYVIIKNQDETIIYAIIKFK